MKKLVLCFVCVLVGSMALAQNATINGSVIDSISNDGLEYASVSLLNSSTGKTVNGAMTDADGKFEISKIPAGNYYLEISFLGYITKKVTGISIEAGDERVLAGTVLIAPNTELLSTVVVEGQKMLVENKIDRLVYNADQDVTNSGGDAADVMRKVPMVTVDVEGNLKLRGSGNVRILINGKPSSMMSSDPAEALKMLPSDQIEKVEVMTSPSAKYDAEGTAGIINIITREKGIVGLSGNTNLSASGRGGNAGASVNYRKNKLGINANIGGRYFESSGYSSTNRINTFENTTNFLTQRGDNTHVRKGLRAGLGLDYDIDDKNNVSTSFNFNNFDRSHNDVFSNISTNANQEIIENYLRNSDGTWGMNGFDWNADYTHKFKNPKQELYIAGQYSHGIRKNDYELFQNPVGQEVNYRENSLNDNTNNETTLQLDYIHPFKKEGMILELGAKTILRDINSDYTVSTFNDGEFGLDPSRSNVFDYSQDVYAAYATFAYNINKKYGFKAGLRYEKTEIQGDYQSQLDTGFSSNYQNFIPSIALIRHLKPGQAIKLSYSRRIQRPGLRYMNPYVDRSDAKNIRFGNPALSPELSHSYELGWNTFFKGTSISTTLYYRLTDDVIESVTSLVEDGVSATTFQNVSNSSSYGLNVFGSTQLTPKWGISGSVNLYEYEIKSNTNNSYTNNSFMYSMNLNSNVSFGKGFSASAFGMFNSPRVTLQGKRSSWSMLSVGLQKEILKEKGSIGLRVTNPYKKNQVFDNDVVGEFFTQNSQFAFEFRSISLTFKYRFGKKEFKQKRDRHGIDNSDLKGGNGGGGGGGDMGGGQM